MDNKINIYACGNGHETVTKDLHEGTTPMFIGCPKCSQDLGQSVSSYSKWYDVPQDLVPTHEWYAPEEAEKKTLDEQTLEHVNLGGLLLRKIGTAA